MKIVSVFAVIGALTAVSAVDGKIRYREYPGVGHNCWGATYADWDNVLSWFFAQRRSR